MSGSACMGSGGPCSSSRPRLWGSGRLRRCPGARPVVRRPALRSQVPRGSPRDRGSVWGERRVPHVRVRRPDLPARGALPSRRGRPARVLVLPGPRAGGLIPGTLGHDYRYQRSDWTSGTLFLRGGIMRKMIVLILVILVLGIAPVTAGGTAAN